MQGRAFFSGLGFFVLNTNVDLQPLSVTIHQPSITLLPQRLLFNRCRSPSKRSGLPFKCRPIVCIDNELGYWTARIIYFHSKSVLVEAQLVSCLCRLIALGFGFIPKHSMIGIHRRAHHPRRTMSMLYDCWAHHPVQCGLCCLLPGFPSAARVHQHALCACTTPIFHRGPWVPSLWGPGVLGSGPPPILLCLCLVLSPSRRQSGLTKNPLSVLCHLGWFECIWPHKQSSSWQVSAIFARFGC